MKRAPVPKPLRVLIVEDEAVQLMQLEAALEAAGHAVVGTAMSAEEALPMIAELRPELILLDLHLRDGSSGLDVARAARNDDVTVVFLTANVRKLINDMEGAAAVIAKPFSARTLESAMSYLAECVHRLSPSMQLPIGMCLAPAYLARLEAMRATC